MIEMRPIPPEVFEAYAIHDFRSWGALKEFASAEHENVAGFTPEDLNHPTFEVVVKFGTLSREQRTLSGAYIMLHYGAGLMDFIDTPYPPSSSDRNFPLKKAAIAGHATFEISSGVEALAKGAEVGNYLDFKTWAALLKENVPNISVAGLIRFITAHRPLQPNAHERLVDVLAEEFGGMPLDKAKPAKDAKLN